MKKRTKAVLTILFLSLLFFVEINVEARSVRNMSAYPAKHGQSFVQSVWMEQKEVFYNNIYHYNNGSQEFFYGPCAVSG